MAAPMGTLHTLDTPTSTLQLDIWQSAGILGRLQAAWSFCCHHYQSPALTQCFCGQLLFMQVPQSVASSYFTRGLS
jgi:hypothetical protein